MHMLKSIEDKISNMEKSIKELAIKGSSNECDSSDDEYDESPVATLEHKTKVVINEGYGGFGLSEKAIALLEQLGYKGNTNFDCWAIKRDEPLLVQVVEELGKEADGPNAKLKIVTVVSRFRIVDAYDGKEVVHRA